MAGTWKPGGFPPGVTLAAKMVLLGAMVVRGVDYLVGDSPDTARRLSVIESAAPLWLWGAILVAAGVGGFISILLREGRGVMISHLVGWVAYWALGVGIISDVVKRTGAGWDVLLPPAGALLVGVVCAWIACHFSGWEYAPITTVGIGVTAAFAVASIQLDGLRSATILLSVGLVHGLLALGTASHLRQEKIERSGRDPVGGEPI